MPRKRFSVKIDCENAAFGGDMDAAGLEVIEVLKQVQHHLHQGTYDGALRDSNGNTVGVFYFDGFDDKEEPDMCERYDDGEVIGIDADGCLIQWNADDGCAYNCGETLDEFGGVKMLFPGELRRLHEQG